MDPLLQFVLQGPPPSDPSPRKPQMSTRSNTADNIERHLQSDGHQIWGLVIYRCTYGSSPDWEEFLRRLQHYDRRMLERFNGLDLLDSLRITVFDDQSVFDNASTSFIRDHFKQWAATAPQQEQGTGPVNAQRYQICIQVNEESLASIISRPPPEEYPGLYDRGYVNVIYKDWEPEQPDSDDSDEFDEEPWEPLEECTLYEVGWMRVRYSSGMVGMYYYLRDPVVSWDGEYRRPPEIVEF